MMTLDGEVVDVAPTPGIPRCAAQGCSGVPLTAGGLCLPHRRALRLVTKIQDAVFEFFAPTTRNAIRPGTKHDENIIVAGEFLSEALTLLVGTVLENADIALSRNPIVATVASPSNRKQVRWRINLLWMEEQ